MNEIIGFAGIKYTEPAVVIERTEEFYSISKELSDFIESLPLGQPDNDKLISIIIRQIKAGEHGAFEQGFNMGVNIVKWQEEHPGE